MKLITYSSIFILVVTSICSCSKKDKEIEQNQQVNQEMSQNIEKEKDIRNYLNTYIIEFDNEPDLVKSAERILTQHCPNEIPSSTADQLYTLYNMLFDPNSQNLASRDALGIFYRLNSVEIIQESLLHHEDDVVSSACNYLMELASKDKAKQYSSVPYFIKALNKNNYKLSGSERGVVHTLLKYKIINNINTITGLDFDTNKIDSDDPKQLEEVLSKTKDWAQEHDLKLLDEKLN